MDERKYNYKREQSPLHVKSYEFAVRIVKMFLHLSDVDWRLASLYTGKYYVPGLPSQLMFMNQNSLKAPRILLQSYPLH